MGCGTVAALSACSGLPPATLTLQGGTPGSASDARITVSPAPVGAGAAPDVPLVVRVTDGTDAAATISLVATCLTLTALYTGSYGNGITGQVTTGSKSGTFRIVK